MADAGVSAIGCDQTSTNAPDTFKTFSLSVLGGNTIRMAGLLGRPLVEPLLFAGSNCVCA